MDIACLGKRQFSLARESSEYFSEDLISKCQAFDKIDSIILRKALVKLTQTGGNIPAKGKLRECVQVKRVVKRWS